MYFDDSATFFYLPLALWVMQILIILFPTLLYQSYFKKKFQSVKQRKVWLIIMYGLSILLCMSFPVAVSNGYMLDFRYIPLILGFLYGGYQVGTPLLVAVLLIRFIIGGQGFILTLVICLILIIIFYFTLAKFEKYDSHGKRVYALSLLLLTVIAFGGGTHFFNDQMISAGEFVLLLVFGTLTILTMLSTIQIHESMLELEKINYEIIEYEKMHLISQFSISIAHKLQSPIHNVHKSLDALKSIELPGKGRAIVQDMDDELAKALNIIEDYLVLTNENENPNMCLNVHDEFDYIIQSVQSYAQMHNVELKFYPAVDKNLFIKGDKYQFRHAILNLIKNGIEASKTNNGVVEMAIHEMLDSIYIIIEDNGRGMTSEEVNRIGSPVNSNKKNGTGLGTLVALNIIKSMSGKVDVSSQLNKGTTFSIILPKANGEHAGNE
ncbi:sensor histidine kinase [Bacillus sp. B15-48]|uniref:ATP-binding protein n=1 Tax=Bacillus sp. B15-48 TaxID=1548601 RepID=UPI00193FAB97|nr:sensor histidine kinase [Bacillus sp. B15-48]MBM4760837.1 hypothetical protein [Bacillus sp. B15-48]